MQERGRPVGRVGAVVAPIVFALLVLGAWQLYVELSGVSAATLPAPSEIASAGWEQRALLLDNAGVTIVEILLGYGVAIVGGLLLALLIRSSATIERAVYPWLVASQMVPIVAVAPILVLWLGFDLGPKIVVIALVSFFPIAVNAIDGLRAVDPRLLRLTRTMRASAAQQLRHCRIPAALPFVFSGLKIAAALAVIGSVFAEWVGASEGLGHLILVLNNATETATMFAVVGLLAAIGIGLFLLVLLAERLLLPWYHGPRQDGDR